MRWTGWPLSSPEISYHLCNADQYSDDDVNGDAVNHLHGFPGPVHLESGGEVADAQVD